jgi:hypothetical protein
MSIEMRGGEEDSARTCNMVGCGRSSGDTESMVPGVPVKQPDKPM